MSLSFTKYNNKMQFHFYVAFIPIKIMIDENISQYFLHRIPLVLMKINFFHMLTDSQYFFSFFGLYICLCFVGDFFFFALTYTEFHHIFRDICVRGFMFFILKFNYSILLAHRRFAFYVLIYFSISLYDLFFSFKG